MMKPFPLLATLPLIMAAAPAPEPPKTYPAPSEIVAAAPAADWVAIAPADLMVMDLAADAKGRSRRVVIQLIPAPFSQGWVGNIRKLVAAHWYDGVSVNRVQDNYVVQWGDASETKALPKGLAVAPEIDYTVDVESLSIPIPLEALFPGNTQSEVHARELFRRASDPKVSGKRREQLVNLAMEKSGLNSINRPTDGEKLALISIETTQTELTSNGWHERDSSAQWVEFWNGWPLANLEKGKWVNRNGETVARPPNTQRHVLAQAGITREVTESRFWPVHCYGMVGVGRGMSPDTGSGAELYTVIGHAPRHLDRNIALVGRVIEGIEHLSSLPRGTGALGFYESAEERVPILAVRMGNEVAGLPSYQYLSTESASFAAYADARANRRDPFFIKPAGGADICNIPVPVRRAK